MRDNKKAPSEILSLYRLRVFVEVADRLSFSRAARSLLISQPAVSGHMRNLEQLLGVPLFDQRRHHLALTETGHQLLEYAHRIVALVGETEWALTGTKGQVAGRGIIGYSVTMRALLDVLLDFQSVHPRTTLKLINNTRPTVLQLLREHRIALGFVHGALKDPDLEAVHIYDDDSRPVVIAPLGHPLASQKLVMPEALERYPFVHYPTDSPFWSAYLKRLGVKTNPVAELDSRPAIERAVARGLGISLLDAANLTLDERLVVLPFKGPMLRGPIYAVRSKRRYFSAVERAVLEFVLERFTLKAGN